MKERVIKSSGNVFIDLGFLPEEAAVLAIRAELMTRLRTGIGERGWDPARSLEAFRHRAITRV